MFTLKSLFRSAALCFLSSFAVTGITAHASTALVATGDTVAISVTVDGSAPFSYQWYRNGAVVKGATSVTYQIASFQTTNVGTYSAVISNSFGSTTSDNATLALAAAPLITAQPVSKTVTAGSSVTFSAGVAGSAAVALQWKFKGANIAGATKATLTIANVQAVNAGTYTFAATNSAGSVTSSGAVLTVTTGAAAPAITTQPLSQTVNAGAKVTFSVVASGTPAPTYQWRKNGTALGGATGSSYVITAVTAANAGTYTVVATNAAGAATSNGAVLSVGAANSAPVIITQPTSQTAVVGSQVTFRVVASGVPVPIYQWLKSGGSIAGATSAAYTIPSVAVGDANSYSVRVTNAAGSVRSNGAVLTVTIGVVAPAITTQPVSQTVKAGAKVTFSVAASGKPAPTYQWRKDGKALGGATGSSYVIAAVTAANAGTYTVVATNAAGAATSNGAMLSVGAANSAPDIITHPASQTVGVGSQVTFRVVASGVPVPTYQWLQNGASIAGATSSAYTISAVAAGDAKSYSVKVTNALGSVRSEGGVLTVRAAIAPVVLGASYNSDSKGDLLWQNSTTGECRVWLMNGTAVSSNVTLGAGLAGFKIGGTGDFNGDGKTDILWQNLTTRVSRVWLMAGTTLVSDVSLGSVAPGWLLRGSGDFNGDGKSDLVWQNSVTDECAVWLMNGTAVSSSRSLGQVPADLVITGTGDFNKDGQSDILWQKTVSGASGIWLMTGTTVASSVTLGTQTLDWQMSGAGDLNGDTRSDILWQNLLTGECRVWLMNGTTVSSNVTLATLHLDWVLRN